MQEQYRDFTITYENETARAFLISQIDRHYYNLAKLAQRSAKSLDSKLPTLEIMPDGPWNWQEESQLLYPDGPGHPRGGVTPDKFELREPKYTEPSSTHTRGLVPQSKIPGFPGQILKRG